MDKNRWTLVSQINQWTLGANREGVSRHLEEMRKLASQAADAARTGGRGRNASGSRPAHSSSPRRACRPQDPQDDGCTSEEIEHSVPGPCPRKPRQPPSACCRGCSGRTARRKTRMPSRERRNPSPGSPGDTPAHETSGCGKDERAQPSPGPACRQERRPRGSSRTGTPCPDRSSEERERPNPNRDPAPSAIETRTAEPRRSRPRSPKAANSRKSASASIARISDELRAPDAGELSRLRPQNLPDRNPRHAQILVDPPDRMAVPITGPPNLPYLAHSKHPPPRSSESSEMQWSTRSKGDQS